MTAPLKRLSICACGFGALDDSIPLGTMYNIYPETRRADFDYGCGGCNTIHKNVEVIKCSQILHPDRPPAYLPYGLFEAVQ